MTNKDTKLLTYFHERIDRMGEFDFYEITKQELVDLVRLAEDSPWDVWDEKDLGVW